MITPVHLLPAPIRNAPATTWNGWHSFLSSTGMIQDKEENRQGPVRLDLVHDTMEFAAPTGEEIPLQPEEILDEDDDLTADDLDMLEEDNIDDEAAALICVETDSAADEDNFLMEPDEKDELDDADAE